MIFFALCMYVSVFKEQNQHPFLFLSPQVLLYQALSFEKAVACFTFPLYSVAFGVASII